MDSSAPSCGDGLSRSMVDFLGASLLLAACFSALMAAAGLRDLPIYEALLEGDRRGS